MSSLLLDEHIAGEFCNPPYNSMSVACRPCAVREAVLKSSTSCYSWRLSGSRAKPKDQDRVDWSKRVGPIVTIAVFLISLSQVNGGLQQQLSDVVKGTDRLEGKVERLGDKIDSMSKAGGTIS